MASLNIHFAVAKRYIEKNNVKNKNEFYDGTIAPDLTVDSTKAHYGIEKSKALLIPYLESKTILNDFLAENEISNDYNRALFLHLITDYLFFNHFFDHSYLMKSNYASFTKDLYYSYDVIADYLQSKYCLDLKKHKKVITELIETAKREKNVCDIIGENILNRNQLDGFIEYVSGINLMKYRLKLLDCKINVLPN